MMYKEPALILAALVFFVSHGLAAVLPDQHIPDDVVLGMALLLLGLLVRWKVVSPATHDAARQEAREEGARRGRQGSDESAADDNGALKI